MEGKSQRNDNISDEAVKAKTGKIWKEWFKILDKAGSKKKNHKEIVAYLKENFDVNMWWQQAITVAYEQERGLREKHETTSGFQVSASKTFNAPVELLFRSFMDKKKKKWLKENISVRKSSENKIIRADWIDKNSSLEVYFYPKNNNKTQVVVQHNKLPDGNQAKTKKIFWKKKLENLKEITENYGK